MMTVDFNRLPARVHSFDSSFCHRQVPAKPGQKELSFEPECKVGLLFGRKEPRYAGIPSRG